MTTPLSDERLAALRERWERGDAVGWSDAIDTIGEAVQTIAVLLDEVERLREWLRECDRAFGGDGSDDSLLGLVYTCGAAKDALAEVERLRAENANMASDAAVAKAFHDEAVAELKFEVYKREQADAARIRAEKRVAALEGVLRSVEWPRSLQLPDGTWECVCPICYGINYDGHHPDCALDAALRDASE